MNIKEANKKKLLNNEILSLLNHRLTKLDPFHKVIDGAYVSGSMFTYLSDALTQSEADAKIFDDNVYSSPQGIGIAVMETLVFIALSALASDTLKKKHDIFKYAAIFWPYLRNFCSGLKNGRHAVVNVGILAQHFVQNSIYAFSNPVGLAIGGLYAIVLIWYRYQSRQRDEAIKNNKEILEKITNEKLTDLINLQIQSFSKTKSGFMYAAAFSDGLLDGLYMFGNLVLILSLFHVSLLATPVGALVAAFIVIGLMTLVSVINKMIDEHKRQRELQKSADLCKLAVEKNKKALNLENTYDKDLAAFNAKYNEPYTPATKIGQCIWAIARTCINAIKSFNAALETLGKFIRRGISVIITFILGSIYALYLGTRKLFEKLKKPAADQKDLSLEKEKVQINAHPYPPPPPPETEKQPVAVTVLRELIIPKQIKLMLLGKNHQQKAPKTMQPIHPIIPIQPQAYPAAAAA